ncbi:PTS sugar transporter subunit IIA [[Eubacterium] hominis]|uniref:PTS sugar transporter subunit IIA n=1 Tax=[Eubacterium] hominis TaxID=2764325 RepID=UPI003A4D31A5
MSLFKKKIKKLYAIADGTNVPMEEVPDEVFSTNMMGEGVALIPDTGNIYAPCDGEISMLMEHSLHAFGIINEDGMELLIHIGLNSVELMGEGFQAHTAKGKHVHKGELLISFDKELLKEKGINDITMMVLVEPKGHKIVDICPDIHVQKGETCWLSYQ